VYRHMNLMEVVAWKGNLEHCMAHSMKHHMFSMAVTSNDFPWRRTTHLKSKLYTLNARASIVQRGRMWQTPLQKRSKL
jgi:hypothetical protein